MQEGSAGDQLLRRDMSEPQHEQLSALLDTIYQGFTTAVAASRGKSVAEVGSSPGASCPAALGACL